MGLLTGWPSGESFERPTSLSFRVRPHSAVSLTLVAPMVLNHGSYPVSTKGANQMGVRACMPSTDGFARIIARLKKCECSNF